MNILDIRTVLFSYVVTNLVCLAVMVTLWSQHRRRFAGLGFWLADFVLQFVAVLLILLRGTLPDFFSILFGVPMTLVGTLFLFIGLERYTGRTSKQTLNFILLLILTLVHAWFTFFQPSLQARNINFSLGLMLLSLQVSWLLLRRAEPEMRREARSIGIVFIVYALLSLGRVFIDLLIPPGNELFQSGLYDTLVIFTYQVLFITITFFLILLVNRRLRVDLERDISVRQQTEEALKNSEEKFSKAFQNSPDVIILTSLVDGRIIEANESFFRVSGYSREESLGSSTLALELWGLPEGRLAFVEGLVKAGRVLNYETSFRRKSGELFTGWISGEIMELQGTRCVLSIIHDVTERKQAQDALRQSEENYRLLIDQASDGIFMADSQGHYIDVNQRGCEMLGYSRAEILALTMKDLVAPQDLQATPLRIDEMRLGETVTSERNMIHRDGSLLPVEISGRMLPDGRLLGFVRDITSRRQTEQTLRDSEERYRTVADFTFDWEYWQSPDGSFNYISPSCERITGYTAAEFIAAPALLDRIVLAEDLPAFNRHKEFLGRDDHQRHMHEIDIRILRKDGEVRWIGHSCKVISRPDGTSLGLRATNRDITERITMETDLRRSEEQYRLLFETIRDGFALHEIILDATGRPCDYRFLEVNPAFEQMTGLNGSEIVGNTVLQVLPNTEPHWIATYGEVALTGKPVRFESFSQELGKFYEIIAFCPQKDQFATLVVDITARKQAELELTETTAYLDNLFNYANAPIIVWDPAFRITRFNHAFERLTGYTSEEVLGRHLELLFPPENREFSMHQILQTLAGARWESVEISIQHCDGSQRLALWNSANLYAQDETTVIATIAQGQDITERKRAETMLRMRLELIEFSTNHNLEELLQKTLDQVCELTGSPIGFYHFVDQDQKSLTLHAWSTRTEQEYCQAEGRGMHYSIDQAGVWVDCIHARQPVVHNDYASLPHRKGLPEGHAPLVRELVVPILRGENVVAILGVGNKLQDYNTEDITMVAYFADLAWEIAERRRAQEILESYTERLESDVELRTRELKAIQEKLLRQEKLALLGQLAGSIAHELRNPLGVISNATTFLRMIQPEAGGKVHEYLDIIENETRHSGTIITGLLDLTRLKPGEQGPVVLSELIAQVMARFPVPSDVKVRTIFPADLPRAWVNPGQVEQVFGNLVTNACQAMPSGGKLTISASLGDGMIEVAVRDSGTGISPADMTRLFEPLFTTKAKGIGLGLALSQKLVEANGGRIQAASDPGKGSTFTVFLPIEPSSPQAPGG